VDGDRDRAQIEMSLCSGRVVLRVLVLAAMVSTAAADPAAPRCGEPAWRPIAGAIWRGCEDFHGYLRKTCAEFAGKVTKCQAEASLESDGHLVIGAVDSISDRWIAELALAHGRWGLVRLDVHDPK
jgi:hypothetical protein